MLIYNYKRLGIYENNPFQVIDQSAVGSVIRQAMKVINKYKPELDVMVCGEHGGDFDSIQFFRSIGINKFSCSLSKIIECRYALALDS